LAAAAIAPSRAFGQATTFAPRFEVNPVEVDNGSFVVAAFWRYGLGCLLASPGGDGFGCINQSAPDPRNEGLLLSKSNQTALPGQATAEIKGVKGSFLFELGYDLRKANSIASSDQGSECNNNSPRFEIQMADNANYYIPCQLPTDDLSTSLYWRRPVWGGSSALVACVGQGSPAAVCTPTEIGCADPNGCGLDKRVVSMRIVQDVGPDDEDNGGLEEFGLAVLDNIDVNGRLKGSGPAPRHGDEDEGQGRDNGGRELHFLDSPSVPASSTFDFSDAIANMNLVGVNGARGISYTSGPSGQPCVTFSGDGLVNDKSGFAYTFNACDLSTIGSQLGTYNIAVTSSAGTLYSQAGSLTVGFIAIHPPPLAAFTANCTNLSCAFDASGSTGLVTSYHWSWGDETTSDGGPTATHTFAFADTFSVTLTVTDSVGRSALVTHAIAVTTPPSGPTAAFTFACSGFSCSFDGSASTGGVVAWHWSWGDETTTDGGPTATHAFTFADTFSVSLTVTDAAGNIGVVTHTVTVTNPNPGPTAAFTFSCTGRTCSFDGSGSTGPAAITAYFWSWGDESTSDGGPTASHTFPFGDTFGVTLTVTDSTGASAGVTHAVTVP